jgi:V/A-type H+-transporting ATPase subunit I
MIYVGSDYDLDYFLSIHPSPILSSDKIEMRIDRPLGELQTHLQFVKESLHQLEAELKGYAGQIEALHEILLERLNAHNLSTVKQELSFPLNNSLFYIEAWVPESKLSLLHQIVDPMAIHCEKVRIEEGEKVPTYIKNQSVARIGEDLVKIYDVPDTTDQDPSRWVFWFFVLFFSMIVNDGGYGFLYLGLCIYAKCKYRKARSAIKRLLNLATILSVGCIIWGVLSASFFGLELNPKGWVSRLSAIHHVVNQKAQYHMTHQDDVYQSWVTKYPQLRSAIDPQEFVTGATEEKNGHVQYPIEDTFSDNIFLEFALVLGMLHIALSLLRYARRHLAALGWVVFIVGGYLYFPSLLDATSFVHIFGLMDKAEAVGVGLQAMYVGILSAMVLALLQKRLKGASEVTTLISIFGDVLSYLRLYALGLSTAIMAETFNELGQEVGLFLGALVIIAGHAITIAMGLMTGVIHGLRLNFIEWYHYSFHGGGRLFAPLMCFKKKSEQE